MTAVADCIQALAKTFAITYMLTSVNRLDRNIILQTLLVVIGKTN